MKTLLPQALRAGDEIAVLAPASGVRAARYGIATGAHFGVSAVIDDAGDDEWTNRGGAAAIAGNWDLTVSCFVDLDGIDRYEAGALSFGRAGHVEDGQRGTESLALFVDLGGAQDSYPALDVTPRLGNGVQSATSVTEKGPDKQPRTIGRGVFVDK